MSDSDMSAWGPLAALAGSWVGDVGVDVSFHNAKGVVGTTEYMEKVDLKPFGPVDNGSQVLYGLDYRMAAWRKGEEDQNPFHTEVGYWLWDATAGQVMRCFMVPRGTVLIAGSEAGADAAEFTLRADKGDACYGVLENKYLGVNATTESFECRITVHDTDSWSYDEDTIVRLTALGDSMHHTDRNTLRRVS